MTKRWVELEELCTWLPSAVKETDEILKCFGPAPYNTYPCDPHYYYVDEALVVRLEAALEELVQVANQIDNLIKSEGGQCTTV
jgi:hypothetical protein